jgi:hypothetical protein
MYLHLSVYVKIPRIIYRVAEIFGIKVGMMLMAVVD